jgi:hypothetical protein
MTERQDVRPLTTEDLIPENRTPDSAERYDSRPDDAVADDYRTDDTADDIADDDDLDDETVDDTHDEPAVEETPVVTEERAPTADDAAEGAPLFGVEEIEQYRVEWRALQSDFVDSPRDAVQHADELVAQVIQSLATTFADHKRSLEGQWNQGEQIDTEELRVALRRYRSFFDQLLTV